jgi:nitrate/nitrite transporter NarK
MLQDRFGFSEATAGQLFGIPYTISACASPFLGFMIDRVGKRVLLVILANLILLVAHGSNMLFDDCD